MVIMGSDDQVISNELVRSAIKRLCSNRITQVLVSGGGHYIHDLQYHYFRLMMTEFLGSDRKISLGSSRLRVDHIGFADSH